ncbi:MAG: DUF4097 domain-containing protein [Arenimonas sp.]|uniref:DUF4097 family beta strand repeat-containing protein n=1 Tax=Arenimonas sp. TaxID=1872635 RepID=UPI0025BB7A5E|nr:DUF4097 family beta strand repeat-containing protein [Arenimonas sp.]MBW8368569.1 DUF4097 domain-containing protein [Arenimonas sp.]
MTTRTVFCAALLVLASAPAFAATPISQVRPLSATGSVSIENMKGRIVVRTWDRAQVGITGSLGEGVEKLVVEGTADNLRIEVRYPSGGGSWFGWGGKSGQGQASAIEVSVPNGAGVAVDSVSASVDVSGVAGRSLSVDTVSGDVLVRAAQPGKASIDSVSGDLDLELQTASLAVDTVSGEVRIRGGVTGVVEVETVSGDVELAAGQVERLAISSVSGDSRVRASLAPGGRITADSVSGGLILALPRDTSARLRVETFSGDITSPAGEVNSEPYGPGKSLQTRLGAGAGDIGLESFSGDVRIDLE